MKRKKCSKGRLSDGEDFPTEQEQKEEANSPSQSRKKQMIDLSLEADENTDDLEEPEGVQLESYDFLTQHFCWDADEAFIRRARDSTMKRIEPVDVHMFSDNGCCCSAIWRQAEKIQFDAASCLKLFQFRIFSKLLRNVNALGKKCADFAESAQRLYQIVGRYMDLCLVSEIDYTLPLAMHSLNHVLRTRNLIISNKQRLESLKDKGALTDEEIERCRDQGLARPKVLILCPFRKHAYAYVEAMIQLLFGSTTDRRFVSHWDKFDDEFGDDGNRVHEKRRVSEDYRQLMSGNVDDCFRVGIALAKKSLKLYASFDTADILICSPLGLRMIVGDEEKNSKRDYDFLASIEVLIVDKANILMMQNWEHLLNLLDIINTPPKRVLTDIQRVRHWSSSGYARDYRQTVILSDYDLLELHALMGRYASNYVGQITIVPSVKNTQPLFTQLEVPVLQAMYRIDDGSSSMMVDPERQAIDRFNYFVKEVLMRCHSTADDHILIFVPSYYDFVRLRNHMKRENDSFAQCHEYAATGKVAKARQMFLRGQRKFLLITERFYFYFRYLIKGVRSVVFYQLPLNPHFYTEIINMARPVDDGGYVDAAQVNSNVNVKVIYSRFDTLRLQNIFGAAMTKRLLDTTLSACHVLAAQ